MRVRIFDVDHVYLSISFDATRKRYFEAKSIATNSSYARIYFYSMIKILRSERLLMVSCAFLQRKQL